MDFGSLLHVAKQNETAKKEIKYYSTKFEPPKKEQKNKNLSENIQKFLAKKEEEERQRVLEARRKRDELLAKRDPKLKKKILKHLKVCKSANKSVLEDAIDHVNTAVTIDGCEQPDEDDYGYVSQEASAFYSKMMEKYNNIVEPKKFPDGRKKVNNDLMSTKDRVRAALEREREEALLPHKRHRRTKAELSQENGGGDNSNLSFGQSVGSYSPNEDYNRKQEVKTKPKRPMPPPVAFTDLLKIAEKNEPIKLEQIIEKKLDKEPERLMTSKEKREYEEMQARKEGRKRRDMERQQALSNRLNPHKNSNRSNEIEKKNLTNNDDLQNNKSKSAVNNPSGRIPKLNGYKPKSESNGHSGAPNAPTTHNRPSFKPPSNNKESLPKSKPIANASENTLRKPSSQAYNQNSMKSDTNIDKTFKKPSTTVSNGVMRNGIKPSSSMPRTNEKTPSRMQETSSMNKQKINAKEGRTQSIQNSNPKARTDVKEVRQFPPQDIKPVRQFPPNDVKSARQFPPNDVKSARQFPPKDLKRPRPPDRGAPSKKNVNKRRILDDDSEYDSELDDFIDDGPEEPDNDYSKYIKDIFGYDKSRYRDEEEDDANMESNFAQVMREEYISKKIGIMEDLEDMKMEAMEKKMKEKKKRVK